jgi:hypothetical protein
MTSALSSSTSPPTAAGKSGWQAVVIAIDGLRAAALGAYGNTWHATPELDALASQSIVAEWMFCETPELADFYSGVWNRGQLLSQLRECGAAVTLVTDDDSVAALAAENGVADVWSLEGERGAAAQDVSETALAAVVALAAERLQTWAETPAPAGGRLLWIHARGFFGPWDAPTSLRRSLVEEDDPEPPEFVEPPHDKATSEADDLLGFRAAYAAQTVVLDECLGGLVAAVADAVGRDALTVLVGCRGFALGEHGVVGGGGLYGEVLQIPCLLQAPELAPIPPRCGELTVPSDLGVTLASWFRLPEGEGCNLLKPATNPRQFVRASASSGEHWIRTPAWMLRRPAPGGDAARGPAAELFVKPDDRWEANEVGSRCPDIVERLSAVLASEATCIGANACVLDDDLVTPPS